jgi:O-acetyl-ADP-ribose deacetylase (regulator of RNase III)
MIKKKGDLFSSTARALGHGVNCQGVMGAGIAVAFKEKFPKNYQTYHNACATQMLSPGEAMVNYEDNLHIANIASQEKPGKDARYDWTFHGLLDAALQLDIRDINTLAIPLIGCGIGGLEWEGVEYLVRAVEVIVPGFEFEVWKL